MLALRVAWFHWEYYGIPIGVRNSKDTWKLPLKFTRVAVYTEYIQAGS
jgi:hypothetical protein